MENILEIFNSTKSDKIFIKDAISNFEITYEEFQIECLTFSNYLKSTFHFQDKIIVQIENSIDFFIALISVIKSGKTAIPIPLDSTDSFIFEVEKSSGASLFIKKDGLSSLKKRKYRILTNNDSVLYESNHINPKFENINNIPSKNNPLLLYTSGSTGSPKGVIISHKNILFSTKSILNYLGLNCEDIILNVLPAHFDYGLYQFFLAAYSNSTLIVYSKPIWSGEFYKILNEEKITVLPIMPSIVGILDNIQNKIKNEAKKNLRIVTSTGDVFHPTQIELVSFMFPNASVFSMYGMTECKRISYLPPKFALSKPYSVGIPMDGVNVKIVDDNFNELPDETEGILLVEGENVTEGYISDNDLTNKMFRLIDNKKVLITYDYFKKGKDGFLYFLGRKDNIVKIAGNRVNIKDIDKIIMSHPNVSESLTIVVYNKIFGNLLETQIVLKDYTNEITFIGEIRNYIAKRVYHKFMSPAKIKIVKELNKSNNFKTVN